MTPEEIDYYVNRMICHKMTTGNSKHTISVFEDGSYAFAEFDTHELEPAQ